MSEELVEAIDAYFGDDGHMVRAIEAAGILAFGSADCHDSSLVDALYRGLAPDSDEGRSLTGAVEQLAASAKRIGDAITPNICGSSDASGGHVESLTEAVMGMTGGMMRIAEAVESLAKAVKGH